MNIDEWWPKLPARVRLELAANPHAPMSSDAVFEMTRAAGFGPAGAAFEGRPMEHYLLESEAEWIEKLSDEEIADAAEQDAQDTLDDALRSFPDEI